jgi:hypothetical protein
MRKFENRLWSDLLNEHGADLAMPARPTRRRTRGVLPATAAALSVVLMMVVVALSLSANTTSPAYAVSQDSDGTITVKIKELAGISGANQQLAKLGVPVRARPEKVYSPTCKLTPMRTPSLFTKILHPSRQPFAVKIDPNAIPPGATLLISARLMRIPYPHLPVRGDYRKRNLQGAALTFVLTKDPVPACALGR